MPLLLVATIAAIAYDGWFFYSRWRERRQAEQARREQEAEQARRTIDMLGGGELKILSFYANPGAIRRGQPAELCYGVYGAKSVRIEPPVESLNPSTAYCFQVTPRTSTEFKLVAQDGAGRTVTRGLRLQVAP